MKVGVGFALFCAFAAISCFGQEITFITAKANLVASKATIDAPGLAGNPQAIIVAAAVGDTRDLNPHTVGAWYYNDKWNIFNTDHATMPAGLKFKLQIYLRPSADQFMHVVTKQSLGDLGSYIDHPSLNNNPRITFRFLQNHAPDYRAGALNRFEARAEYDPSVGKWYLKNAGGEPMLPNTAYNIVISPGAESGPYTSTPPSVRPSPIPGSQPTPTSTPMPVPVGSVITPLATLAPPQIAPLTVVAREEWAIPYQGNILLSSGLCKIVYGSYSNPNILATDTVIVTGQAVAEGAYLKWTAVVDIGAVHLNVCNWKKMTLWASAAMDLNGRKVNILVLR